MNQIPWYRSPVLTTALTAFLAQLSTMFDEAFLTALLAGQRGAVARAISLVLTAGVVAFRVGSSVQPVTLTKNGADAANSSPPGGQGGFARPMLLAILLGLAVLTVPVLQGCQLLGLQQPKSFDETYAYALGQTTALRTAARISLDARQISLADAQYVLALTDQSRALLDTSRQVFDAGDVLKGKAQLDLAVAVLLQLQQFLNERATK